MTRPAPSGPSPSMNEGRRRKPSTTGEVGGGLTAREYSTLFAFIVAMALMALVLGMALTSIDQQPAATPTPAAVSFPVAPVVTPATLGDLLAREEVEASPTPTSTPAREDPPAAGVTLTPAEPGWWGPVLSQQQIRGLALYVSDDAAWADFAARCFSGGGENRGYVGAVGGPNDDGSFDHGLGQNNDGTLDYLGYDAARVRRDPVYAMDALYRTYQVQGAGAWFGC